AVYGSDRGTITRSGASYIVDPDGSGAAPSFAFFNPDFNVRSLRGNAVLRWEYRPGSAIYMVWQQQRSGYVPTGDFVFGRDVRGVFATRATNIFLVKATYWIGH
ncbi:MAG: DUF5916 domain-containing protein, partial [Gemmatimonadetes bacterium]|nr:DUF5916 domain-containing protein [Gemmatimonadota bacterium]